MPPAFSFSWRTFFCRGGSLFFCRELGFCFRREAFLLSPGFSFYQEASLSTSRLFFFQEAFLFAGRLFFLSGDFSFCQEAFLPKQYYCRHPNHLNHPHSQRYFQRSAQGGLDVRAVLKLTVSFPDYGSCLYTKKIEAKILFGRVVLRFRVLQIT